VVLEGADQLLGGIGGRAGPLVDLLSLTGRGGGIGVTLVSDRPSEMSSQLLEHVEVLIAARTRGPAEHGAIRSWLKSRVDAGTARRILESLPSLEADEAWVCSPTWLRASQRVTLRHRATYDGFGARLNRLRPPQSRASASELRRLRTRLPDAPDEAPASLWPVPPTVVASVSHAHGELPRKLQADAAGTADVDEPHERRRGRPVERLVLSASEKAMLQRYAAAAEHAPQLAVRAQIVLACAEGRLNSDVACDLGVSLSMVGRWRRRFVQERLRGLELPLSAIPESSEQA
jgi:hypothetical protein